MHRYRGGCCIRDDEFSYELKKADLLACRNGSQQISFFRFLIGTYQRYRKSAFWNLPSQDMDP